MGPGFPVHTFRLCQNISDIVLSVLLAHLGRKTCHVLTASPEVWPAYPQSTGHLPLGVFEVICTWGGV
jgi:hypothetical protein